MDNGTPVSRRRRKKFGSNLVPLFSLTALVVLLSLGLAGVWQLLDPIDYIPPAVSSSVPVPETSQTPQSSSVPEEPSSQPLSSDVEVAQGEWVASSYFDDAMFVGDSITEGIKLYEVMSNTTVLSHTGINLDSIFTKEVIAAADGSKKTIVEASKDYDPAKIYVLMGINSVLSGEDAFVKSYERLIDELMAQHPDATLYIQSILPVTAEYEKRKNAVTDNATIDSFNKRLKELAEQKGVYYLNVAEIFKDETGALHAQASPKDGIHFGANWYRKWFDYLRTHAVS